MQQRPRRRLILSLALLSGLAALLPGHPAGAADPDFTGVSDILGGPALSHGDR
jgi:hypothetical protein